MRCSASPTTCNAAVKPAFSPAAAERDPAAADATTAFTTLLLDIALKPISDAVGVLGSAVTDGVAERIARAAFEAQQ